MNTKERAAKIIAILRKVYPDAKCTLDFTNPLELLVATILAAQCTDERVNIVTKTLFKKHKTADDYAKAPLAELEAQIRSTGFYHNKAKSIQKAAAAIVTRHAGKVPATMEELLALGGVGRKTANVVLGNVFNIPGIIVDTHVLRVSQRLRLTQEEDPVKVESDLSTLIPQKEWTKFSHWLVAHGRKICKARKPACPICPIGDYCPSKGKIT